MAVFFLAPEVRACFKFTVFHKCPGQQATSPLRQANVISVLSISLGSCTLQVLSQHFCQFYQLCRPSLHSNCIWSSACHGGYPGTSLVMQWSKFLGEYHNILVIFHGTNDVLYLMLWTQLPTKCQVSGLNHYISRRVSTIPGLSSEPR